MVAAAGKASEVKGPKLVSVATVLTLCNKFEPQVWAKIHCKITSLSDGLVLRVVCAEGVFDSSKTKSHKIFLL